jgi:hypothetical protein
MALQSENNTTELIDIKAETVKNEMAIAAALKDSPQMSSFFGGGSGADTEYGGKGTPSASRQTSEVEYFMTVGVGGQNKEMEVAKQGMEVMFDGGSRGQSMFLGNGRSGSFNITYAGEKGAGPRGPAKGQGGTPLVDPGYREKARMARKGVGGGNLDTRHGFGGTVNMLGDAVSGRNGAHGTPYVPQSLAQSITPQMASCMSFGPQLLHDRNVLYQMQHGPMSRNRLIHDLQDGKEIAERQYNKMPAGERVEVFRNVAPSVKNEILDRPGK